MERTLRTKYGRRKFQVISLWNTGILVVKRHRKIKALEGVVDIPIGTILMPRMGEYQIFLFGVYEAVRSRKHALIGYGRERLKGGEKQELNKIINELRETVYDLLQYSELSENEKRKINNRLTTLYSQFIKKRNPLKNEARDYIQSSFKIIDSLGRINPSATSAKLSTARIRLEKRIEDIRDIAVRLQFWEIIFLNSLEMSVEVFEDLFNYTDDILKKPDFDKQKLSFELEHFAQRLKKIIINPFVGTAYYCLKDINELNQTKDFSEQDKIILQRLNQASLLKIKQRELERIIWWFRKTQENEKKFYDRKKFKKDIYQKVRVFEKNIKEDLTDKNFKKKIFLPIFWSKFDVLYQCLEISDFKTVLDYLKSISHDF